MTSCDVARENLSAHVERTLEPDAEAAVVAHLDACAPCARLAEALAAVIDGMPFLAEPFPSRMPDRVARTPLAARVALVRARRVAFQRAAAWAIVFAGAWWQLFGGTATTFAQEAVPAASGVIVSARKVVAREMARRQVTFGPALGAHARPSPDGKETAR